jgi:hypothetical protein
VFCKLLGSFFVLFSHIILFGISRRKRNVVLCKIVLLNPIELIWAQVKGFVAKNNITFRLKDAKELTYAAFGKITKDVLTKAEGNL